MRPAAGRCVRLLAAVVAATLPAACTTTTTTVSSSQPTTRVEAAPVEREADAGRRSRARLELAAAYFSRGQNATALEEVELALKISPGSAEAYNLRGLVQGAMNRPEQAEESFRRALQIQPRDVDALHNYGWFQCQQQRYDEAQKLFTQALALPEGRDAPRTLLVQGVCQARASRLLEADQTLTRAFEIEPGNPAVAVNLAEVLLRRGDLERARFYIRRVNLQRDLSTAQTLWLAARIERRAGNDAMLADIGRELRGRFPDSREAADFDRGLFDQ